MIVHIDQKLVFAADAGTAVLIALAVTDDDSGLVLIARDVLLLESQLQRLLQERHLMDWLVMRMKTRIGTKIMMMVDVT